MTLGVIGKKVGMTQVFDSEGQSVSVTVVEVESMQISQIKTLDKDGYNAVQVGYNKCRKKSLNKPELGHLEHNDVEPYKNLKEFRVDDISIYKVGDPVTAALLSEGELIDASGVSIGKGFQGTVKRWGFGRGPMTHGSKNHRKPGSIGAGTTPSRVYKGLKMAGKMGNRNVTVKKLLVVKIMEDKNVVLVKGSVPGANGATVVLKPTIKEWNKGVKN